MMTTVIVDDEYLAIAVLQEYASRMPALTVPQTFENPKDALVYLQQHPVDLLLLDIQMPYLTGFDLLQKLPEPPLVIFTTARHEYAVQAYELDVLDYLVKPIAFERFEKAIHRAMEYKEYRQQRREAAGPVASDHIMIRADHRIHKINLQDILFIEGLSEYVKIYTTGKMYITYAALKDLVAELPEQGFVRTHKSFIVHRAALKSFNSQKIFLVNDQVVPIGRAYKAAVQEWLNR